jgi:hypothetical protein
MHIQPVDLSGQFRVLIVVFARAVLAEPDDLPITSGGQDLAASGGLSFDDFGPIANRVCGEPFAVPSLRRAIPIRLLPGGSVKVPERVGIGWISGDDCGLGHRPNFARVIGLS